MAKEAKSEKDRDYRKDMLDYLGIADRGIAIENGLKSKGSNLDAKKELDKYSKDAVLKDPIRGGKPLYTEEQWKKLTEEERKQKLEEGFQAKQAFYMGEAYGILKDKLENVLKEDGKWSSKLEKIANSKELAEAAVANKVKDFAKTYEPVIKAYGLYQGAKRIADKFEVEEKEGKKKVKVKEPLAEEEEKVLMSQDVAGAIQSSRTEKYIETLRKSRKYDEATIRAVAKVAAKAPSEFTIEDKYEAAKKFKKDAEDELKKAAGKRDYHEVIGDYVANTLKSMVKSSNSEQEQMALQLVYNAFSGNSFGRRNFNEVFKKDKKK